MIRTLTQPEVDALNAYAARHGRTWKNELRTDWYHARAIGILHALRNDPCWSYQGLDKFKAQ